MDYNFRDIEKKWQKRWAENKTYQVKEDNNKKKFYVLNMFPYPSGAGLHVGHPLGYIASDIYARYKRQKGFNVLNPMGYDAYGLPAEQYAIQTGQHPAITTEENINRYRSQLDKIGFSFDWDREVRTCDPEYYHWTQWAFQKMFDSYYDYTADKAMPISALIEHLNTKGTEGLNVAYTEELNISADEWKAMDEIQQQRTLMNYKNIELGALNNTIGRLYEEQAANLGMSRGQFMAGVADSDTFKKNLDMYNKYKAFEKAHTTTQRVETGYLGGQTRLKTVRDNAINPYAAYKGWGVFKDDGRLFKQINGYIDQRASLQSSIYSDYGQMYRTFNRVDNRLSGGGGGGSRGGGGGGTNTPPPPPAGSIAEQEAKVQALTKAWREATDEVGRAGYAGMLEEAKQVLDQMQGKTKEVIPEGSFKDLKNQLGDLQKQRELLADPVDIAVIDQDIERIKEKINTLNGVMKQGSTPMSLEEKIRTDLADSITAVDENTLTNLLEFKIKNGLDNLDINSDYLKQAIFGERMDISDDYWQDLAERINEQLASMGIEPITIDVKTGEVVQAAKKAKDGWQDAAQAVQAVGGALQQLEDPGAKIMGIIGEAIANIALGFAQATAQASVGGPFAWIAAIAGGLGTMLSTIAAIKSATAGSYAEGGIVPGNNYSDGLIANVSSGELILNRAQQNSIAGLLTSNQGNSESRPYVDVETIWLGLGHYLNRKGMGEIVTTR